MIKNIILNLLLGIPIICYGVALFILYYLDDKNSLVNWSTFIITLVPALLTAFLFFVRIKGLSNKLRLAFLHFSIEFSRIFYFSITFVIIGYLFGIGTTVKNPTKVVDILQNWFIVFSVIMGISVIGAIIIYLVKLNEREELRNKREKRKEVKIIEHLDSNKKEMHALIQTNKKLLEEITQSGNIPIEEFVNLAINKEANILAVAGNLKSLSSDRGLDLLKKYLNGNVKNKLELFVPLGTKKYLNKIKESLESDLKQRVEVNYVRPFLFLQGIVFAGKIKLDVEKKETFETIGYYLYKPIIDREKKISEYGIFVDLSNGEEVSEYDQAIAAYYKHLKSETFFSGNEYTFIPGIFEGRLEQIDYFNHIADSKILIDIE